MQLPRVGDVVIYHCDEQDAKEQREDGGNVLKRLPAVVVNVFPQPPVAGNIGPEASAPLLNLRVLGDGNGVMWRTSVKRGKGPREWYERGI